MYWESHFGSEVLDQQGHPVDIDRLWDELC